MINGKRSTTDMRLGVFLHNSGFAQIWNSEFAQIWPRRGLPDVSMVPRMMFAAVQHSFCANTRPAIAELGIVDSSLLCSQNIYSPSHPAAIAFRARKMNSRGCGKPMSVASAFAGISS